MSKPASNRFALYIVLAVIAAAAGFGYYINSLKLSDTSAASATAAEASSDQAPVTPFDASALSLGNDELIIGRRSAPVTIVEYSSLSCPHCGHFHTTILPEVKKAVIDTGDAKLVIRPFPLNLPALRAAMLVACAPKASQVTLLETLYTQQDDWAFTPAFEARLKTIAEANGIDAAAFDRCMADAATEARILGSRKTGMEKLHVSGTPSFFINGAPLTLSDGLTAKAIIDAVGVAKTK
jgi:protein-disulfide isomerase